MCWMMLSTQPANLSSSSLQIVDVASVSAEMLSDVDEAATSVASRREGRDSEQLESAPPTSELVVVSDSNPSSRSQLDGDPVFDVFETDVAVERAASAPAMSVLQAGRSLSSSLFCRFFILADITALSSS